MTTPDPAPAKATVTKSLRVAPETWKRFRIVAMTLDLESGPALEALLDAYDAQVSDTASNGGTHR